VNKSTLLSFLTQVYDAEKDKRAKGQVLYPPIIEDLWPLHEGVVKRKALSILEYGSGWSTLVLAMALEHNKALYNEVVKSKIRHPNPFCLMTVDASRTYSNIAVSRAKQYSTTDIIPVVSKSKLIEFQNNICHVFTKVPPFTADFIYLDGPDSSQVKGSIRGFHLRFGSNKRKYGMPMSADILSIEFFLWPGTTLVVDGRGANAQFLLKSLRRNWQYFYDPESDQHTFELIEPSWGKISQALLELKNMEN